MSQSTRARGHNKNTGGGLLVGGGRGQEKKGKRRGPSWPSLLYPHATSRSSAKATTPTFLPAALLVPQLPCHLLHPLHQRGLVAGHHTVFVRCVLQRRQPVLRLVDGQRVEDLALGRSFRRRRVSPPVRCAPLSLFRVLGRCPTVHSEIDDKGADAAYDFHAVLQLAQAKHRVDKVRLRNCARPHVLVQLVATELVPCPPSRVLAPDRTPPPDREPGQSQTRRDARRWPRVRQHEHHAYQDGGLLRTSRMPCCRYPRMYTNKAAFKPYV